FDSGRAVALDLHGGAYIVGDTVFGTTFPTTTGAFQTTPPGDSDVFVVKIGGLAPEIHPALSIQKTASTGGACPGSESVSVLVGTTVTYCYAIANTGNVAIDAVVVADNGRSASIGTLAAAQSSSVSIDIVANASEDAAATASGVAFGTAVSSA